MCIVSNVISEQRVLYLYKVHVLKKEEYTQISIQKFWYETGEISVYNSNYSITKDPAMWMVVAGPGQWQVGLLGNESTGRDKYYPDSKVHGKPFHQGPLNKNSLSWIRA